MLVKIGSVVVAELWGGEEVTGKVLSIEICPLGSKYGKSVKSCNLEKHSNGVLSLDCWHWCYFYQVKSVLAQNSYK